ncbi:MAG: FIST C-terminal domain-containing protein [Planctomycetes bacterium]|nr:FIST C-terminal domain-containing protein [Planctomycetota bacterium]
MRAIIGHSDEVCTKTAVEQVLEQCSAQLDGDTPKAAMLFMSTDYDHAEALGLVAAQWPEVPLIGGSTDGEVSSLLGFVRDSVLLTVLVGDEIEAMACVAHDLSGDIEAAVDSVIGKLGGRKPALCVTTFAPSTNSSEVVRQLDRRLGAGTCPIVGGLTGDHREFARTAEFAGKEVLTDSLPVLFLFGKVRVSWGIGSGWFPIGPAHVVTRSTGHEVFEIDDKPATELYREYWGNVPEDSLGEYPLAVFPNGDQGASCLRAPLGTDIAGGSIRFAGEVAQGAVVRITEVLPEGILAGSVDSVRGAVANYSGTAPALALVFSCAARKWVLGTKATEEVGLLREQFAETGWQDVPVAGFYCFGEIAPFQSGDEGQFHNETCVTVLIGG